MFINVMYVVINVFIKEVVKRAEHVIVILSSFQGYS